MEGLGYDRMSRDAHVRGPVQIDHDHDRVYLWDGRVSFTRVRSGSHIVAHSTTPEAGDTGGEDERG